MVKVHERSVKKYVLFVYLVLIACRENCVYHLQFRKLISLITTNPVQSINSISFQKLSNNNLYMLVCGFYCLSSRVGWLVLED